MHVEARSKSLPSFFRHLRFVGLLVFVLGFVVEVETGFLIDPDVQIMLCWQ